MTPFEVYDLINHSTASTGGTAHGLSKDVKAVECGLSSAFAENEPPHTFTVPQQFYTLNKKGESVPRIIGNRAGSAFHALQEALPLPGDLGDPRDYDDTDVAVGAAVMAYQRCMKQDASDTDYLGKRTATEFTIAGSIAGHARTGRLDSVRECSEEHVDRWAEYGVLAASPGLYGWDYKLLKAVTLSAGEGYALEMQGLAYMLMYEEQTGVHLDGFVYELVSRAANPSIDRLLMLVPNLESNRPIIEGFVTLAASRRLEGAAVASKCSSQYGKCRFITICPRFGNRISNAELLANQALLRQLPSEDEE